jgi:hypothetical protein
MRILYLIVFMLCYLFENCKTVKDLQQSKGDRNDAVKNAIFDYIDSKVFNKNDSVFFIRVMDINSDILGIVISAQKNKISVIKEKDSILSYRLFPTRYFEQSGKLFLWTDSTQKTPVDLIDKLKSLNRIDTAIIGKYYPKKIVDDAQKAMNYFFCKNNLKKYKKVYTSIAMGWYTPPEIKCDN